MCIRDRSWNEGIAATTGDWVYISTAGDTIERDHLLHLLDLGERAAADVVISPPCFVNEAGAPCEDLGWPPSEVIAGSVLKEPFVLTAEAGFVLTFVHCPSGFSGARLRTYTAETTYALDPSPPNSKGRGIPYGSSGMLHRAVFASRHRSARPSACIPKRKKSATTSWPNW